jgi:Ni2+-binding GTPase involved in maturation of urease and hydrogenase
MGTIVACIGGFLGAGKTTALQAAAAEIERRGRIAAVITNDQGSELVDTQAMRRQGVDTAEITGGCFCCKFEDLVSTMGAIVERRRPDVILAEAVGSCTDLSATVYQPLRKFYRDTFTLAPLSVLAEPSRVRALRDKGSARFPDSVRYLFSKQLAEADLIVLNKIDTLEAGDRREITRWLHDAGAGAPVHAMSARSNAGVAEWVDRLLGGSAAGSRLLEIDYDTYAAAEAVLGWLNATAELTSAGDLPPKAVAEGFIQRVQEMATDAGMAIAHVKALVSAGADSDRIALTDEAETAQWSGAARFTPASRMSLVINARVRAEPEDLKRLVLDALQASAAAFASTAAVHHMECFSPARPTPRHRFANIVQ